MCSGACFIESIVLANAGVTALRASAGDYATALGEGPDALTSEAIEEGKQNQLHTILLPLTATQRLVAAQSFVNDFLAAPGHMVTDEKKMAYLTARAAFLKNEVDLFHNKLQRKLATVEFTHQRPQDEPEYGSLRAITSFTLGSHHDAESNTDVPNWEVTFNAGFDFFYNNQPEQDGRRLRDFQVAFQGDRKLWRWTFLNQPTFTLAGYYQRLTDNMVINFNSDALAPGTDIPLPKPANVILQGTKGNVEIAQAKLNLPLGSSGVSVPLSVSWSNRTEFIKVPGNDVRGHFGIQFDLDKLLSTLKSSLK